MSTRTNYMTRLQTDISWHMRTILVDWLVEVAEEYNQSQAVLFLAVRLVDRFLELNSIMRDRLQLVGIAALGLASKLLSVNHVRADELIYISDRTYSLQDLVRMEATMCATFSFDLLQETTWEAFVRHRGVMSNVAVQMLAQYLLELCLLSGQCWYSYSDEAIAEACIRVATGCASADEDNPDSLVRQLWITPDMGVPNVSLTAARTKYSSPSYFSVALQTPPEIPSSSSS